MKEKTLMDRWYIFPIYIVISSAFFIGCDSDEYGEFVQIQDLRCSSDEDCIIKSVPSCCGTTMEFSDQCVSSTYVPAEKVDCSDNRTCASQIPIDYCACETLQFEKICVGKQFDSGVGD